MTCFHILLCWQVSARVAEGGEGGAVHIAWEQDSVRHIQVRGSRTVSAIYRYVGAGQCPPYTGTSTWEQDSVRHKQVPVRGSRTVPAIYRYVEAGQCPPYTGTWEQDSVRHIQ